MTPKWTLEFAQTFSNKMAKLDLITQKRIYQFLTKKFLNHPEPEKLAKPLQGSFKGLHLFRIGDDRVLIKITKGTLVTIAIDVNHRKKFYQ